MRKEFNVTGSCNPEWHYMMDTTERFEAVERLIDTGKYFTINRARQYGKTTTLTNDLVSAFRPLFGDSIQF